MDEARIKALFQQHARLTAAPLTDASTVDILAVLSTHGSSADKIGPLDRVASSPSAAAITRVMAELDQDCEALARDLRQARAKQPRRLQRFARRGLVMAAGSGALALLFAMNPGSLDLQDGIQSPLDPADVISVISFEGSTQDRSDSPARRPAESIFSGNFDS